MAAPPDAPIPVRTWVWTAIITFSPVQTDPNTHLFIYLNLLTGACHIFMLEVFWCRKKKKIKTGAIETPNFYKTQVKLAVNPCEGLGVDLHHHIWFSPVQTNPNTHLFT